MKPYNIYAVTSMIVVFIGCLLLILAWWTSGVRSAIAAIQAPASVSSTLIQPLDMTALQKALASISGGQ